MSPGAKKLLFPFLIVDLIFLVAILAWMSHHTKPAAQSPTAATPNIQVDLRHLDAKLTEVGLINKGDAPGPFDKSVNVTWQDTDLDQAKGLSGFEERDTGRFSAQFIPQDSLHNVMLAPGERRTVGWVKLRDDAPVHADIATTQP